MFVVVDAEEVRRLQKDGARVLDVLPRKEFRRAHLPGAEHVPLGDLDRTRVAGFEADRPIVVYCHDQR